MLSNKEWMKLVDDAIEFFKRTRESMGPDHWEEWDRQIVIWEAKKQNAEGLLWVTVNVRPDVTFEQLDKAVLKMISKTWIQQYAYAYEFRGKSEGNNGLHVHIALPRGRKRPSEANREIRNTFKNLVGLPDQHIDIRMYDIGLLNDKVNYLSGIKDDDRKEDSIAFTVAERERLKIKQIYRHNI